MDANKVCQELNGQGKIAVTKVNDKSQAFASTSHILKPTAIRSPNLHRGPLLTVMIAVSWEYIRI